MSLFSPLEQFEIVVLRPIYGTFVEDVWFDFSITNVTIYLGLIYFAVRMFRMLAISGNQLVSHNWYYLMNALYNFIASLIKQQTGSANFVYVPIIFTTFIFILCANLLGLLPFGYTVTGQILITFTIAFSFNFGFFLLGWQKRGFGFLRLFVPKNAPLLFKPLIAVIELVSYLLRTFSLSIRLFANMMAGHTLLHILSSFCFVGGLFFSFIPWLLVFAVVISEFAIAFIQAYVFTILLIIYLNDAINVHGH